MKWRILKHTDGNNNIYYTVQYKRWYWFWCNHYIHTTNSFWGWEIERFEELAMAEQVMDLEKEKHEFKKRSKQIKIEVVKETK